MLCKHQINVKHLLAIKKYIIFLIKYNIGVLSIGLNYYIEIKNVLGIS